MSPSVLELAPEREPTRRESRRGHPWLTLVAVTFGVFMVGLDGSVVAIANPAIAKDLHASLSDLQWITNAYLLALAVLLVFGGKLGDRYGRRKLFLTGVVGFGISSVLIGVINNTEGIIVLRVLQGAFGAMLMPNTLALLRSTFPEEQLNLAVGIWGGASAVSIAAGPIIGGLLVEHVSWQSVFFINAPMGLIALVVGALVLRESRDERPDHAHDPGGILTLAGGLFLIVYGLIKASSWGWGGANTILTLVSGLVVLLLFVAIERRVRQPLLPLRLFANVSLSVATLVVLIGMLALFGVLFFVTLYLQNVHGLSPVDAGVRTLPLSVSMMVGAPIAGALTQRFGPRPLMFVGALGIAGGLLGMLGLHAESGFGALWPSFVALGAGMGFVMTASTEAIVGNAPVEDAGIAGGLQSTAVQLGGVMGTAILGSVLSGRVGSVLPHQLAHAGVPGPLAHQLVAAKALVGEGATPPLAHLTPGLQHAVVNASHASFMTGLHTSMLVGGVLVCAGAALSLLVRRGESPTEGALAVH